MCGCYIIYCISHLSSIFIGWHFLGGITNHESITCLVCNWVSVSNWMLLSIFHCKQYSFIAHVWNTVFIQRNSFRPSQKLFFSEDPLKIVKAQGQYMFDEAGVRYLDCINNVCHGNCWLSVLLLLMQLLQWGTAIIKLLRQVIVRWQNWTLTRGTSMTVW